MTRFELQFEPFEQEGRETRKSQAILSRQKAQALEADAGVRAPIGARDIFATTANFWCLLAAILPNRLIRQADTSPESFLHQPRLIWVEPVVLNGLVLAERKKPDGDIGLHPTPKHFRRKKAQALEADAGVRAPIGARDIFATTANSWRLLAAILPNRFALHRAAA